LGDLGIEGKIVLVFTVWI